MNDEHDTDIRLEQALDIVEAGAVISEQQLSQLLADDGLLADVLLAKQLQSAARASRCPADVEQRLSAFRQQHGSSRAGHSSLRLRVWSALAAAALFAGVLFMLHRWGGPALQEAPLAQVFTADSVQTGLMLTTGKGQTVALSAATEQHTSVSLDDFYKVLSEAQTERVTLSVPYGKSADIILSDGSVAYLHPGSRLVFPTTFTDHERAVVLYGEAYFKVVADARHPFVVKAGAVQTTVLGTEFHVDSEAGEVVLVSGSVRVGSGTAECSLRPGQRCTVTCTDAAEGRHEAPVLSVTDTDVTPYEMWRDGYLYFDNVELKTILEAIGQNFNMTVKFRNSEALNVKMRFMAERNKGVASAVEMMNRMKKVVVSIEGNCLLVD